MSLPREVIRGRTYMITRRCSERRFFLRPDEETNEAFTYCLALAASRSGIGLHFMHAASNHYHAGVTDHEGRYPVFLHYFHEFVAKSQNALRGRSENFWSSEQTSVVRLVEAPDVLSKMVYALTNPVKDHLVEHVEEWPGVNSYQTTLTGGVLVAKRPKHFFRDDGDMPETVVLKLTRPPGFEKMTDDDFAAEIKKQVTAVEQTMAEERQKTGIQVLGRKRILEQDWRASPDSEASRSDINPRVAARSKWAREEALVRNKAFVEAHSNARQRFKDGEKDVVFPAGTWWLRRYAGVACEAAEDQPAPA